MSGRTRLTLAVAVSLLAVASGMGFATVAALRLDAAQVEATRRAFEEEQVRLALWRLDSTVLPLLTVEGARPYDGWGGTDPVAPIHGYFQMADGTAVEVLATAAEARPPGGLDALAAAGLPSVDGTAPVADLSVAQAQAQVAYDSALGQSIKNVMEYQQRVQIVANPRGGPDPVAGPLVPTWIGETLVLARRVRIGDGDAIQGAWVDFAALRGELLATIADLLPEADLRKVDDAVDEHAAERRLAALPAELVPGPVPLPEAAGPRPIRLTLAAAWLAVLLGAGGVTALLVGAARLAERRAEFVSTVTHELRTPLTTFRLYTEMLEAEMVPEARRAEYVTTLKQESERLSRLVENVLLFSRMEVAGGAALAEPVGVPDLLDRIVPRLEARAEEAGLALRVEGDAPQSRVRVDPAVVEQILFNLVDNAAKYAAEGAPPRIDLCVSATPKRIVFEVRDHGPGVEPADRRHVFRPFAKARRDAAGTRPGVGLGLALCRRLARQAGGDLRLASPAGGGAAFVFELPTA